MTKKIIWIFVLLLVACAGFYAGAHHHEPVEIPQKQFQVSAKCVESKPIHYTNTENDIIVSEYDRYFSQCMCFIADDAHTPVFWDLDSVSHIKYIADDAVTAYNKCNSECLTLCNVAVQDALKNNPNFQIPTRW